MNAATAGLAGLLAWLGAVEPAPRVADELARLQGQRVSLAADGASYTIEDIAGEGQPMVGVIVRDDGGALALRLESGETVRLVGPLARPRIAGPGYKVWVLGDRTPAGALRARRLGVLAPPWKRADGRRPSVD